MSTRDAFVVEGKMALPYQYFAGAVASRFIIALRDEKKIYGARCAKCAVTFVPPRQVCQRCFTPLGDKWIEVGPGGVVENFTVVRYAEPYQPTQPPYILALIRLDGADVAIAHVLRCEFEQARPGMQVSAVFSDVPHDNMLAISHFAPV